MSADIDAFTTECKRHGWGWSLSYYPETTALCGDGEVRAVIEDTGGEPYTATVHIQGSTVVSHDTALSRAMQRSLYIARKAQEGDL